MLFLHLILKSVIYTRAVEGWEAGRERNIKTREGEKKKGAWIYVLNANTARDGVQLHSQDC